MFYHRPIFSLVLFMFIGLSYICSSPTPFSTSLLWLSQLFFCAFIPSSVFFFSASGVRINELRFQSPLLQTRISIYRPHPRGILCTISKFYKIGHTQQNYGHLKGDKFQGRFKCTNDYCKENFFSTVRGLKILSKISFLKIVK